MKEVAQHVQDMYGMRLSPAQLTAFETYEQQLMEWNTCYNLTAIKESEKIRALHFLDSLTCLDVIRDTPMERMIDIGSGAGFPGLPLKIIYPGIHLTLVDSVGKKTRFCSHMVKTLALEGVDVIKDRAEVLGQQPEHRQQYDWALARAVAVLPVLVEYLLPLVRVGGSMLAMKGEAAHAEAHSAEHAIKVLGGHLREVVRVTLPGIAEEHYLIVIDKVAATPPGYPRRVGVPSKKPLKLDGDFISDLN